MKQLFVQSALVAFQMGLLAPFVFAQAKAPAPAASSSVEEEIRRLNADEVNAFLHRDPRQMAHLWSDDFVVTNPLNKFVDKKAVLGLVESGFLVITVYERHIEYIRVYGDTVIVAGSETATWGGKMPAAGQSQKLRFTAVWMKQKGRWQEVARHANILLE